MPPSSTDFCPLFISRVLQTAIVTVCLLTSLPEQAAAASAGPEPVLVKNINTQAAGTNPSYPSNAPAPVWLNGRYVFAFPTSAYGQELWVSDDTPAGMHLLADLAPGTLSSNPDSFTLNAAGDRLFFRTRDQRGTELWVTDGTTEGTLRLTDPLNAAGDSRRADGMQPFRDGMLWASQFEGQQRALWFSDGTVAGTRPLMVWTSAYIENAFFNPNRVISGGVCYLWISSATDSQLWRTDGTVEGTRQIGVFPWASQALLHVVGEQLIFIAGDAKKGWQIWATDGTPEGTRSLAALDRGPEAPQITQIMATPNRLFFTATTQKDGHELWSCDGTETGTGIVKSLAPGRADAEVILLHTLGDRLCFTARTKTDGKEFWVTDGTPEGTEMKDIHPGKGDAIGWQHVVAGDHLYFRAWDGVHDALWVSDGTLAGTVLAASFFPGRNYLNPQELSVQEGRLSFVSQPNQEDDAPMQVWLSADGSPSGIQLAVADLAPFGPSGVTRLVQVNGKVLIPHSPPSNLSTPSPQVDLISHDPGTGTRETLFSSSVANVSWLWVSPSRAVFSSRVSTEAGVKVVFYRTDGTATGTQLLAEFPSNTLRGFLVADDTMWFQAPDAGQAGRMTLWKMDGTPEGTSAAPAPAVQDAHASPSILGSLGEIAFFSADDGIHGLELWRSDGTEAGTFMLKEIFPGTTFPPTSSNSPYKNPLTVHGSYAGLLYFTVAIASQSRKELWRTDGTEAGTFMLLDVYSWLSAVDPAEFTVLDGVVYFIAPGAGLQVWRTDGTVAGTRKATDIASHYANVAPGQLTVWKGRLAFVGSGSAGRDIWTTNGTPQDTVPLSPNASGWRQFEVRSTTVLTAAGDFLYWRDDIGLYRTDGTPGTRTTLATGDFRSISLLVRPPVPGAAVLPDQHVVFFVRNGKLWRCSPEDTAPVELHPSGVATTLKLDGDRVVFMQTLPLQSNASLWSSDGTPGGTQQLLPALITPPLLASTPQRLYYVHTDASGLKSLESARLDGSDRTTLHALADSDVLTLERIEDEHVFFMKQVSTQTGERLLIQTSGTLESTHEYRTSTLYWSGLVRAGNRVFLTASHPTAGRELHSLTFDAAPSLTLEQGGEGSPLSIGEDDLIELPPQVLHQPRVRTLHLRNTALQPLTDLTFTTPGLTDFEITPSSIATLAPGAMAQIQITFTPQQVGLRETTTTFSSNLGATPFTRTLTLRSRGLALDAAPENLAASGSRLVLAGQPVSLAADIVAPAGITTSGWQRTPGTALAETGPVLTLPAVQLEDAAVYTYHVSTPAGEITSPPASLGVVLPAASRTQVPVNALLDLSCTATAPPGSTLSYQWTFKNHPLRSGGRIQGSQTSRLRIEHLSTDDFGFYECRVTLHAPDRSVTLSHGRTEVLQLLPPEIVVDVPVGYYVGQFMQHQVGTTQPADTIILKNLPPGLTANSTGLISGRPTKALAMDRDTEMPRLYNITAVAQNAAGTGQPAIVNIAILPIANFGTYHALLDRSEVMAGSQNLGGRITVTVPTSGGSFSGQLVHGGKTYRFTGPRFANDLTLEGEVDYEVPIVYDREQPPLRLILSGAGGGGYLSATLLDSEGHRLHSPLDLQASKSDAERIQGTGIYNVLLSPRPAKEGDTEPTPPVGPQVPGGTGYLVVNLAKSGTATYKGKLADGTAVTGSSPIFGETNPQIRLHTPFKKITGSLHGHLTATERGISPTSHHLTWLKAPDQSRTYGDGILLHRLTPEGSLWVKPNRERLFWDLQYIGYNLKINLTGPGLPEEGVRQYAGISLTNHRVTLPLKVEGNMMQKLSISSTTGLFKGSFRLQALPGPDLPPKTVTIPFEGAFTTDGAARGFFLLPELTEEEWLLKDPRQLSGTLEFTPNTP